MFQWNWKNLTKKLSNFSNHSLNGNNIGFNSKCISCIKKSTEEGEQSLFTSNQEKQSSQFTSYSLIEVTGGGTKELVTVNLNSNAEGKARNLNIYTYNKGKVKKIWSTSDQIIAYNKKQKTIAGLQYSVLSENGSEMEKYYIYKYNGKKIVKKASYFFEREGHFEDEDGNKVTTNLEKSEKTVHRVIDKEIYSKKEKGKLTYISEKQYRSATKNDVRVWAYNNTTKKELIKKLRK